MGEAIGVPSNVFPADVGLHSRFGGGQGDVGSTHVRVAASAAQLRNQKSQNWQTHGFPKCSIMLKVPSPEAALGRGLSVNMASRGFALTARGRCPPQEGHLLGGQFPSTQSRQIPAGLFHPNGVGGLGLPLSWRLDPLMAVPPPGLGQERPWTAPEGPLLSHSGLWPGVHILADGGGMFGHTPDMDASPASFVYERRGVGTHCTGVRCSELTALP